MGASAGAGTGFELDLASDPPPAGPGANPRASSIPPGLGFELDLGSVPPPAHPPAAPGAHAGPGEEGRPEGLRVDLASLPPSAATSPSKQLPNPSRDRPAVAAAIIDAEEEAIAALAGFGPAPQKLLACVPYAWHVWKRRQALKQLEAGQREQHAQTRRTLRGRIAEIIDEAAVTQRDALAPLLEPIRQMDQLVAARTAEAEATQGQLFTHLEQIDRDLGTLAEQRKQLERDANLAQVHVEDANQKRRHAEIELERVNQKIQTAREAAQREADVGQEFASPEHARRIQALQAEATAAAQALAARDAAASQAQATLRERQKAIRDVDVRVRAAQAQRIAAEREGQMAQNNSMTALQAARDQRLDAYEDTLVAINTEQRGLLTPEQHARTDDIYRELEQNDVLLERHRRAATAYDRQAFLRGVGIVAGAAALLLVLLVVILV